MGKGCWQINKVQSKKVVVVYLQRQYPAQMIPVRGLLMFADFCNIPEDPLSHRNVLKPWVAGWKLHLIHAHGSFPVGAVNPQVIHFQKPLAKLIFQNLHIAKCATVQEALSQVSHRQVYEYAERRITRKTISGN